MAKRSELAQKLLDDIRLRKEKMGLVSSVHQASPTGNSNGNSRWSFQGPGEATASKSRNNDVPSTQVTKIDAKRHRTPSLRGAYHDIIPAGQTRSGEHNIDMSMALALALSNIGKLQNLELLSNAKVGNKLIMHHGSLNFREMDKRLVGPSTSQFSFLSPLQIEDMSKGVQSFNMILRAFSNGINFSSDSMDIGRELLKDTIDLEESLRMLMSLQDASDYMVGSKGKQTMLLKRKEEESSEVKSWKLIKPRFSFDRPSRHLNSPSREGSNADQIKQKQMALAYPDNSKAPNSSSGKGSNVSIQLSYHRRFLSCNSYSRPDAQFLEQASKVSHSEEERNLTSHNRSNSTNTKQSGPKETSRIEKIRILNVVAKLMGLEEFPLPVSEPRKTKTQDTFRPNLVEGNGKTVTKASEINKKEANKMTYAAPKMKKQNEILQDEGLVETKVMNIFHAIHKGNKDVEDLNGTGNMDKPSNYPPKAHLKFNKQMEVVNTDQSKEFKDKKQEAEEAGEKTSRKQQICSELVWKSADAKPSAKCGVQNTTSLQHEYGDRTVKRREQSKKNEVPKEQRNAQINNNVLQKEFVEHISKSKQTGREKAAELKQDSKAKLQPIRAKKREVKSKNTNKSSDEMKIEMVESVASTTVTSRSSANINDKEQPKEYLPSSHIDKEKLMNRNIAYHEVNKISKNEKLEERRSLKSVAETDKEKNLPLILAPSIWKPVPNPSARETEGIKITSEKKNNRNITVDDPERIKNREGKSENLKKQTSFFLELEHRWKERTGNGRSTISSCSMNAMDHPQEIIPLGNPSCSPDIYCKNSSIDMVDCKPGNVVEPTQSHSTTHTEPAGPQPSEVYCKADLKQQATTMENPTKGLGDKRQLNNSSSFRCLNFAPSDTEEQGSLTKIDPMQSHCAIHTEPAAPQPSEVYCKGDLKQQFTSREDLIKGTGDKRQLSNSSSFRCLNFARSHTDGQGSLTKTDPMQGHSTTHTEPQGPQLSEVYRKADLKQQATPMENPSKGPNDKRQFSNSSSFGCLNFAPSDTDEQGSLAKSDQALKQILLKNQHFLNTAQAVCKIKIPIGVLQASENVCQSEENNNILVDCACELMRRKGEVEELMFRNRMCSVTQISYLDALVKELNGEFESLKFPRKIEGDDYDTAEFLHKMVESDVQHRNPDVNSMWDFGWNSMILANIEKDEIMKDVEKHLLNGIINDIARDLIKVNIIAL